MHIQELILRLQRFWADRGCLIGQPYDLEKGAGTMNPLTFFGALGSKPWNVAYVEPSRRPADGRYGENPFRVYKHLQFQVILICMFLGGYDNIFDLVHGEVKTDDGVFPITYGQMRQREEFELSAYSFEHADLDLHRTLFDAFEKEGWRLLKDHNHFLSAYEQALKMSHTFNVLDARGAVSTTERPGIIKRVRDLACDCARRYLEFETAKTPTAENAESAEKNGVVSGKGGAK